MKRTKNQEKATLNKSFLYALEGIFAGVRNERNMKIHCAAVVCATIAGIFFGISAMEWCLCIILFGMVISLELVNTALESVVDLVTDEWKPLAKTAKDTAAGAVLVAAVVAVIVGGIIFLPKIVELL